jgi:ankyrin repeat protein
MRPWDVVDYLMSKGADLNLGATTGTHPLSFALQFNRLDEALAMVNAGENPNLCDTHYLLPIDYVAQSGDVALMKAFIAHHADVNLNGVEGPAIDRAVGYNYPGLVKVLLDAGARLDLPWTTDPIQGEQDMGPTPTILGSACINNDLAMIDLLVAHGVARNEIGDDKRTPLTEAIMRAQPPTILHLLDQGVDPNQPDGYDQTPLMVEILYNNDSALIQGLLDHGAHIEQTNAAGQTALIFAAMHLQDEALRYLVDHGANINAVDKMGETALGYAGSRGDSGITDFLAVHGATRTDVHVAAWAPADPPLSPARTFGLAVAAMYPQYNGENPHVLGFAQDQASEVRYELKRWWGVTDKASYFQTLNKLEGGEFGADYRTSGAKYAQMSDATFALFQSVSLTGRPDDTKGMRDSYLKWKDRSGLAWDRCRYVNLVNDGYASGYIDANEAWANILPVAQELQKDFSSWKEMADNFLDSRAIWNHGHGERFEKCVALLLDPQQPNSVWNQVPWTTDLTK